MFSLSLDESEKNQLLACIEAAVKTAPNSLNAAQLVLPLAQKIANLKSDVPEPDSAG